MSMIIEWILTKLPIGKILMVLAAIAAAVGLYFYWENQVETKALMQYNKTQLEEVNKEQKALAKTMEQFTKDQADLIQKQMEYKDSVDKKFSNLGTYLESPEAKKADGPANEILKRTIEEMQRARGK